MYFKRFFIFSIPVACILYPAGYPAAAPPVNFISGLSLIESLAFSQNLTLNVARDTKRLLPTRTKQTVETVGLFNNRAEQKIFY